MSASRLDVLLAETGLDPADQQTLTALEEMLALVPDEAPRPSAELQAVLEHGPSTPRRPGHPLRTGVVAGIVGLAATVGVGGLAAAANQLPPDVQRVVSHWSHRHLPFTFPMPERSPHATSVPRHPAPSATALPAPRVSSPSTSPSGGDRGSDAGAAPAARPDSSSSVTHGVATSKTHHADAASSRSSPAAGASPAAGHHEQEPGSAARGHRAAGSKPQHATGRPTDVPSDVPSAVPSAQSKRQDAGHRADKHGNSSGHRRMTQSRRDRSPGGP